MPAVPYNGQVCLKCGQKKTQTRKVHGVPGYWECRPCRTGLHARLKREKVVKEQRQPVVVPPEQINAKSRELDAAIFRARLEAGMIDGHRRVRAEVPYRCALVDAAL